MRLPAWGIRQKLSAAFVAVSLVIAGFGTAAIQIQLDTVQRAVLLEAEHLANSIAYTGIEDVLGKPAFLQSYVDGLDALYGRDVVFVDLNKKGIADADKSEVGRIFDHDPDDEVGKTMRDGKTRTFVEQSEQHPTGVRQIVVPLREEQAKGDSPVIGAVILEYSQIYEVLFGAVRERLVLIGGTGAICVLLSIVFGLRIARQIAGRIENLRAGVGIVAAGDYETRVSVTSADELGALGTAFNDMAQALKASRDELEERVAVRTRELSQANNQLRAEVEQRAQAEAKMAHLAQFDPLTQLPNRVMFRDRLEQTMAQSRRTDRPSAVLFIDLDRFKLINDTLGHAVGDKLLQAAAKRITACTRNGDTVGRFGGDEFGVILSDLAKPGDAGLVADKIIEAFAAPLELEGHQTVVTASIGITLYPEDAANAEALIMNADAAMYRAKELGRNAFQFFTREMNERAIARVSMEASMRRALERGEFVLHYQPRVDIGSGAICGVEALLRWAHPERGLVSPAEFIPVLEETGLIVPAGEWVIREACRQIMAWRGTRLKVPPVAVNLSARQLQREDLESSVRMILSETGVDPALLQFEITESLLMSDPESTARLLRGLKRAGVSLSVDDFGTGYSSLAYLKRFPLDELKIDRAFVRDIVMDSDDAAITLAIISLAHSLKLRVVAEGVETEEQLNLLALHFCDEFQGFYFSKPVPATEVATMLREGRRLERARSRMDGTPAVLLLDDDEHDLEVFETALRGEFKVLTAKTPESAFSLLASHPVGVVISDQRMPGLSGTEFLGKLRKLYPDALRVALTGLQDPEMLADAVNEAGIHKFLSKNWDRDRLRAEVREAYQRYRAGVRA